MLALLLLDVCVCVCVLRDVQLAKHTVRHEVPYLCKNKCYKMKRCDGQFEVLLLSLDMP